MSGLTLVVALDEPVSLEVQAFSSCLDFIEKEMAKYPPGSDEDEEFREQVLMDLFRNAGAPMTTVKQLRSRYQGGNIAECSTDLAELVGLLMFLLKDEPCIPCENTSLRERMLAVADEAYKELDERKRQSSSFPTLKEEASTDDGGSTTKKQRAGSDASSASGKKDREDDDDDNGVDDEEEDSSSSSSSSSTSKSRKEMNRLIDGKQYVQIEKIAQIQQQMDSSTRKRVERLLGILHAVSIGSEDDCYVLAETFAPMFARPNGTAYMSIRHHRELPRIKLVLWVWIENFVDITNLVKDPQSTGGTKSAASTPPPGNRHLLSMHAIKPRLSSVSSTGIPFSPPFHALQVPILGEGGELLNSSNRHSPAGARHSRKKTPPRISDLMQKRKIDYEQVETVITGTMDLLFGALGEDEDAKNRTKAKVDNWIAHESGQGPVSFQPKKLASMSDFDLQQPKRQWATKERVIIEKRVLKKRLLHWDKEFEHKNNRKPGKDDRYEMRSVFQAYGALKTLLQALESSSVAPNSDQLLILEKRALQAVLKLFEKDFEERMGRKVEVAADIAGRELEYSRYKELKETVKGS